MLGCGAHGGCHVACGRHRVLVEDYEGWGVAVLIQAAGRGGVGIGGDALDVHREGERQLALHAVEDVLLEGRVAHGIVAERGRGTGEVESDDVAHRRDTGNDEGLEALAFRLLAGLTLLVLPLLELAVAGDVGLGSLLGACGGSLAFRLLLLGGQRLLGAVADAGGESTSLAGVLGGVAVRGGSGAVGLDVLGSEHSLSEERADVADSVVVAESVEFLDSDAELLGGVLDFLAVVPVDAGDEQDAAVLDVVVEVGLVEHALAAGKLDAGDGAVEGHLAEREVGDSDIVGRLAEAHLAGRDGGGAGSGLLRHLLEEAAVDEAVDVVAVEHHAVVGSLALEDAVSLGVSDAPRAQAG